MKLYVTMTSPFARVTRIAVIEHGLEDRVEIVTAQTRQAGSPYYEIAPSGRVPYLVCDDGLALEESDVICAYFDRIGSGPALSRSYDVDGWAYGRLHALARSYLDGIAVWGRETKRPIDDQSPTIIEHERVRSERLADVWEREVSHPLMQEDALNLAQLILYAALDSLQIGYGRPDPTASRPALRAWRARLAERPSIAATVPPARG